MPRRERPPLTTRSEHWIRKAINDYPGDFNRRVAGAFSWQDDERITWVSPLRSDGYAEYYDAEFLVRLGLPELPNALSTFWPRKGPRWDALGKTESGKVILVEAKAYVEEGVPDRSRAQAPQSQQMISNAIAAAKSAFRVPDDVCWNNPFYQYANRLSHLYFLRRRNKIDAYLLFTYFADAPDVPSPCTVQQWEGAERLMKKCLGLSSAHPFAAYTGTVIWRVPDMEQRLERPL